jgi:hypothetical protein
MALGEGQETQTLPDVYFEVIGDLRGTFRTGREAGMRASVPAASLSPELNLIEEAFSKMKGILCAKQQDASSRCGRILQGVLHRTRIQCTVCASEKGKLAVRRGAKPRGLLPRWEVAGLPNSGGATKRRP